MEPNRGADLYSDLHVPTPRPAERSDQREPPLGESDSQVSLEDLAGISRFAEDPEAVRRAFLTVEARVRGVGALFMLFGGLACLGAALSVLGTTLGSANADPADTVETPTLVLASLWGCAAVWTGWGLRLLNPSVRPIAIALGVLSLLSVPIGTVIGAYALATLLPKRGQALFSPEYAQVRRLTPHMQYKMPWGTAAVMVAVTVT